MTVTCLRFATACGMSDRLRLDLVLNDFVAGANEVDYHHTGMNWGRDLPEPEVPSGRDPAEAWYLENRPPHHGG